jgi:hypothetical protein
MAEPQPADIQEGASEPPAPTGTAEDRKAAAALSSLDAQEDESAGKKNVDTKALGEAMKNLSVAKGADEKKKAVKIEASDVALLVRLHDYGGGEYWLTMSTGFRARAPQAESDRSTARERRQCFGSYSLVHRARVLVGLD